MIKTILAIIGILAIFVEFLKFIARLVLRMEHENDVVYYQIIENGNVIWESGNVKEFTSEEHNAFQNFCKEWSKHPGTDAYWNRISK
jgi:hypothetical protein